MKQIRFSALFVNDIFEYNGIHYSKLNHGRGRELATREIRNFKKHQLITPLKTYYKYESAE